jgi:hypothetical protein
MRAGEKKSLSLLGGEGFRERVNVRARGLLAPGNLEKLGQG